MTPLSRLPWGFGLRRNSISPRDLWAEAIARILREEYTSVAKGTRTQEAERWLGIADSWYWFIGRVTTAYGHGVFLFDAETNGCAREEMGVNPFDSGGLFRDKIVADPPFASDRAKRDFFDSAHYALCEWEARIAAYFADNYDHVAEYIRGEPPRVGVAPIVPHAPNTELAWSWEAHVERSRVKSLAHILHLFWTHEDLDYFQTWLETEAPYDLGEARTLQEWLLDSTNLTSLDVSAAPEVAATEYLVQRHGGGVHPTSTTVRP